MGERTINIDKVSSAGAGGNWYHTTTKTLHCYVLCEILLDAFSQTMAKFGLTLQDSRIFTLSMSTGLKKNILANF